MELADEWNEKDFTTNGTISALSVVAYTSGTVTLPEEISLK